IEFGAGGAMYKCSLADYMCTKGGPISPAGGRGAGAPEFLSPEGPGGDPLDGLEYLPPPPQQGGAGAAGRGPSGCAPRARDRALSQPQGRGARGVGYQFPGPETPEVCGSFDGKWEALIQNYNVFLKQAGANEPAFPLSRDGSEGNYY